MKFMFPLLVLAETVIFILGGILIQSTGEHHPALYATYGYFFALAMLACNAWAERRIYSKEPTND